MQTTLMKCASRRSVMVRCEANGSNPINLNKMFPLLNNDVVKKRNATIKENLNKLIAIGSADLKQCYDLAVELDKEHKAALKMSKAENTGVDSTVEATVEDASGENIFLEKSN